MLSEFRDHETPLCSWIFPALINLHVNYILKSLKESLKMAKFEWVQTFFFLYSVIGNGNIIHRFSYSATWCWQVQWEGVEPGRMVLTRPPPREAESSKQGCTSLRLVLFQLITGWGNHMAFFQDLISVYLREEALCWGPTSSAGPSREPSLVDRWS